MRVLRIRIRYRILNTAYDYIRFTLARCSWLPYVSIIQVTMLKKKIQFEEKIMKHMNKKATKLYGIAMNQKA